MVAKRLRYLALAGVLGGLGLSACKDENTVAKVAAAGGGESTVVEAASPAPAEVPKASPEARAKALGYGKYLPKDTQAYFAVYDGKGFVKSILDSKLGAYVQKMAEEQGGVDLEEMTEEPEPKMALSLLADEFFVAIGAGAGDQLNNLMLLSESSSHHQMKFLVKMMDTKLAGKEPDEGPGMGMQAMMMPLIGGLLHDPKAGLAVLEKMQVPPVTVGFKVSDDEMRGQMSEMIAGGLMEMLGEIGPDGEDFAEALEVTRGGTKFTGVKILGKKLSAKMAEEAREQMSEMMDAASVERLIKLVGAKNMVLASGVHDGYVVLFAGTDEEELQIAASPADSMAASSALAFVDGYLDKKLLSVAAISKEALDGLTKNSSALGAMAGGIKAGLSEAEAFGDTRDLEVLLELLMKQEKELLALTKYYDGGMLAYREEGLKIEGFGGSNAPAAKLDTPHSYGGLAKRDNVLLFSNWVNDEDYAEKIMAYLDTIGETVYLGAKRMSTLELDEPEFAQFKEGFGLFESKLRPDLLELWKAIRMDLGKGLGGEAALIVDLQGGLPTVPGIPQVIVDKGKAPRIGLVKPVADRESIGASWKRINKSAEGLLKTISEMSGENIPMQKPLSSEKNDLKTWFFATIPFQTDDFVLSVSIDEKNFYASTSKSFAQEMSADLAEAKPDPARKGAYMTVDFAVLRAYLAEWIKLVDENAEEIFRDDPDSIQELRGSLPMVRDALKALEDLDSIQSHSRMEDGKLRGSFHFKVN